ncbi:retropepsin-like aspartic protease family protein [Polymorphum gilvum]|uniref:Retroviral aspartyl protease domain protein n=1 Tax=Polymorphum gilvum (strain LMG 25793 / CGMCC 1.9160 / SL003B-26A1) TaxID=991905 RepID=F2J2S4_POLGS|nr:TIGR02281 family clan AA aspartic protease [Polymorphum gilvum]ADZ72098.1 Retroviral aspartyl protease domain protein [Polymorphum gilvum SL003B-26A1]
MVRYLVILVVLVALAPFAPGLLQDWVETAQTTAAEQERNQKAGRRVHRIAMADNGHYLAQAELNGKDVTLLVDTGASVVALPEAVARRIGIHPRRDDYTVGVSTANGSIAAAPVTVRELKLGAIRLKDVSAVVIRDDALSVPLLGMSVLGRLQRFDISGDTMVLVQ